MPGEEVNVSLQGPRPRPPCCKMKALKPLFHKKTGYKTHPGPLDPRVCSPEKNENKGRSGGHEWSVQILKEALLCAPSPASGSSFAWPTGKTGIEDLAPPLRKPWLVGGRNSAEVSQRRAQVVV